MKSIIHSLEACAALQPDALLYAFLDAAGNVADSYTYRRFHERTNHLADVLRRTGAIRRNEPVLLVYPPGLEFVVAFFACAKVGALAVPVPPLDSPAPVYAFEKLAAVARDCGATVALTTHNHLEYIQRTAARSAEASRCFTAGPDGSLDWCPTDTIQGACQDLAIDLGSLLLLQYTSGSTQAPRGVMVSHANVVHNGLAVSDDFPIGVSWLPHYHDMGLIGYYLYSVLKQGSVYAFSNSLFLKRPRLWFEAICRYRATISSAPNFAYEYCLREDRISSDTLRDLDLSSLRCLMNASEPVRASTYERFLVKFEPCGLSRQALVVYYGLAENTLSVTGGGRVRVNVNTRLLEEGRLRLETSQSVDGAGSQHTRLVSCGRPMAGVDVRIVHTGTDAILGEDVIGEVWIAGESKANGYWKKPALSRMVFEAVPEGSASGPTYLRTGDLGFIHDGELFVCGRLKDMIIVAGRNYYPNDIEAVVEAASGKVRHGYVAAFAIEGPEGEAVAVMLEARRSNDPPDLDAIARELRRRCQLDVDIIAVVAHGTIVKTSSGKVARLECRKRWQEGYIKPLLQRLRAAQPSLTQNYVADRLHRLIGDAADTATLADIGTDSLMLVEISLYLENLAMKRGFDRAELFDLRVLQAMTLGEVRTFLSHNSPGKPLPVQAGAMYRKRLRSIENDEANLMRQDAQLPVNIAANDLFPPGDTKILLTGATGFLGSFLLEALLRHTRHEIVTVVRAEDAVHARNRVESALQRTGLWQDGTPRSGGLRVQAIPGDIAQPHLGLDLKQWEGLARDVTTVYHCGAEVDYVKPYQALRRPNVSSTLELLRLVTTGSRKLLHHISTTFVFGFTARQICSESDFNDEMHGLNFGYTQTKWVSEQLVREAMRRGVPARVYRPAFVTAARNGRYIRRDLLARLFAYMIRYRVAPSSTNQLSCLPVDVCANNIVALSMLEQPGATTFHLTADKYYSTQAFCESMTRQYGYPFEYMGFAELIAHANRHCRRDDPVFPLLAFLNHNFQRIEDMRDKRYCNNAYRRACALSSACMPEPALDNVVAAIVRFLQYERLVPGPPQNAFSASAGSALPISSVSHPAAR
jgi:thioester reductase-like protein